MKRAKTISYITTYFKTKKYFFVYHIDKTEYIISVHLSSSSTLPKNIKDTIIKNIGMVFLIELSGIVLPKKILINLPFTSAQILFWKEIYEKVVIEKIFIENLAPSILDIPWTIYSKEENTIFQSNNQTNKVILCVSGGKESLASLKVLKSTMKLSLFFLKPNQNVFRKKAYTILNKTFPTTTSLSNEEEIKKELKERYQQRQYTGFNIGHLIFQNLLFSDVFQYVFIGNEYSANFGNTIYRGHEVNHQYIKSYALAKKINTYIHTYITPDFTYLSPFFELYEYKIMELFFKNDTYLELWTSCNRVTNKKNFCSQCFKCAFIYIIALVYKDKSFLGHYFSSDLLQNLFLTLPLMNFKTIKPLDCIGEKKEIWVALDEIHKQKKDTTSPTMQYFLTYVYPFIKTKLPGFKKELLSLRHKDFILPDHFNFADIFKNYMAKV